MSSRRIAKRALILDSDEDEDIDYIFKVLVPNGTSVNLKVTNPNSEMSMQDFVNLVKEEYDNDRKESVLLSKRKRVDWNLGGKFFLESAGEKMKDIVRFAAFKPNICHIIRLDDGSGGTSTMYENLWDLTPDTDMLKELPETYNFETALADLIDNSLQAVWPYREGARKLISVDICGDKITVIDTGRGMDSSQQSCIDKWGKIGASVHRSEKTEAVGGKPPYLKPYFGMFGYGGLFASMFLGRRTLVSSKTKESKKVFTLEFKKEALIENRSVSGKNWKTGGGMRDPLEEEMKLSPHGSFTKVEIFESKYDMSEVYQLQCRLKDIYFPYIQCDELSETGRTERPVEFQVNGVDLAEIAGGEVAITNLHSRGQVYSFQIRFTLAGGKRKETTQVANARLKFVYFPIIQGKESIEKILESLEEEGCKVSESFETFGRISIRRLGRLLPEDRWDPIPFMVKGSRASTLQKCCRRVKCFIDVDAGFSPTPSKTKLADQNPFSVALRNFGIKSTDKKKDDDVSIEIYREGNTVSLAQLDEKYQKWVLEMHNTHDEEAVLGEDEAVHICGSLDKKALGISNEAVRVHKVVKRKGMSWKRGQHIKILKGACAPVHKTNVYATIEYFLIEGFEDEAGGDTRILCRPINRHESEGCKLSIIDGTLGLEIGSSLSLSITIIDSGMCLHMDENEWNKQLDKQQEKAPSKIDLLDGRDCGELNIDGELLVDSVRAGRAPPKQIVAVVRPACFTTSAQSNKLDQKYIVKMDGEEMIMEVKFLEANTKMGEKNAKPICLQRLSPTSRKGISGLYIFSLGAKFPDLFKKAGTYKFSFSIGNSIECTEKVVVKPSLKAAKWGLDNNLEHCDVRVGSSLPTFHIACFDEYENRILFTSVPNVKVELEAKPGFLLKFDKVEANLIKSDSTLKIEKLLVETSELDQIRPSYEATLKITAMNKPFSVSVACKVNPGPLERVVVNNPNALENLLPGSTIQDFTLEMFDGYNNHVAEGTDVLIVVDGYHIEDLMGVNRKVDGRGCIDLSGILKVTRGYGKSVSLSVMYGNEEIFKKESQIEEREIRLVTELPDCCAAGSNLENLIFKVTDSDGSVDTSIHDDEKSGCYHTMSVHSAASSFESTIRYAFVHGTCKVPYLSLPENEGVFSFKVFHSRYPELQMSFKVTTATIESDEFGNSTPCSRLTAPMFERDEMGYSTPYSEPTPPPESGMPLITRTWTTPRSMTPCSQFGVLAIRSSSLTPGTQTSLMDMAQYTEALKEKLNRYEERRAEAQEQLKNLQAEHEQTEQELSRLLASLENLGASFPECLSTKESMMKQIEEKHQDTAASVFCCMYRNAPPPQSLYLSMKGIYGVVALLGSVASTSLSRVLSEYLGKDTMLSLVFKSSTFGPKSDEYRKLQSEAASRGRSITNRFRSISLSATRPWKNGLQKNDPQKRLAIKNPSLPNGDPIPGFKGYAVNMIDLASDELDIQSGSYGLRETLFYGIFGELQVYDTAEHLEAALPFIYWKDAVSLDGVIAAGENGFIYCGSCTPEVHFPITVTENQEKDMLRLEITRDEKRKCEKMMSDVNCSLQKLEKKLRKANERYQQVTSDFS